MKKVCIFQLILVGIPSSILILAVMNRGWAFLLNGQNQLAKLDESYLSTIEHLIYKLPPSYPQQVTYLRLSVVANIKVKCGS